MKTIDIAIHDRLDIADKKLVAMVLDHGVGLEHIGADLAAPGYLLLLGGELGVLLLFFLFVDLVEAGT